MDSKLNMLYESLEKEKVLILYKNIKCTPEKINGLYMPSGPAIIIDNSLLCRPREHRCTLFHEAGHHFMGASANFIAISENYLQAIAKSKDEHRAMLWATAKLISDSELCIAVSNGIHNCYELADYFDVTIQFMMAKLNFSKQTYMWRPVKTIYKKIF